ncbi:short-chain fatty acid transporter [Pseudalkalibacillus decolorationis]|uniref:short-chain fatty acid transporter n=1 Tax=Pseudalkalibacillus decolorationis TaxID=163879 RepID=UPI0021497FB2|nr:TIGR00366 family protein [Pseudalkalibacillus decolorationis]
MLSKAADHVSNGVRRYLPDAFVIAVLMTIFVLVVAILMNLDEPGKIVKAYGDGFWTYLAFTMQMVLLLMTGMVLAAVPFIKNFLLKVASFGNSPTKAYVLTFFVSSIAYYINWGLAVIVGAIVAREIGRRNKNVHFPLLVAAAYSPTVLYTAGLSSSIGLTIATKDHFLADVMGVIPTSDTIFHPATITIFFALLLTIPIFLLLMAPNKNIVSYQHNSDEQTDEDFKRPLLDTPALKLEYSHIVGVLIGTIGLIYVVYEFAHGRDLDLNIINLLFLSAGLFFHRSLGQFASAFKKSATSISPIILQFPFYAGIIAVLGASGMGASIINWMSSVATTETFNVFTYWSAGLVNILAPSGGGQWALQGPLQVPAGMELGVNPGEIAMAVGWGDAWTNLIQPFWALPILSVVGLHIRDIMGYCIILSLWVGAITSVLIYFLY